MAPKETPAHAHLHSFFCFSRQIYVRNLRKFYIWRHLSNSKYCKIRGTTFFRIFYFSQQRNRKYACAKGENHQWRYPGIATAHPLTTFLRTMCPAKAVLPPFFRKGSKGEKNYLWSHLKEVRTKDRKNIQWRYAVCKSLQICVCDPDSDADAQWAAFFSFYCSNSILAWKYKF